MSKLHTKEFLLGIFISAIIFQVFLIYPFIIVFAIFSIYGIVLIGFFSGITAGICNENMIRSVLSGVSGVLIGLFLPPFYGLYSFGGYLSYYNIGALIWYFPIMTILFGGLGGLIGNQIRVIVKKKPLRKLHRDFLLGIIISAIIFQVFFILFGYINYLILQLYGVYLLLGFVTGIIAGIVNEDIIRSVLSGIIGITLSFLPYLFYYGAPFVVIMISAQSFEFELVLSGLLAGLGGYVGYQIRVKRIKQPIVTDIIEKKKKERTEEELYKLQINKEFLLGIFISTIIFQVFFYFFGYFNVFIFQFYGAYVLTGMVCGIITGVVNEDMIRSVLSGIIGLSLYFIVLLIYSGPFIIVILFTSFPLGFELVLSFLFAGLGGLVGNQIRVRLIKKTKPTDIKNAEI